MGKLATIAFAVTFAASVLAWIVLLAGNGDQSTQHTPCWLRLAVLQVFSSLCTSVALQGPSTQCVMTPAGITSGCPGEQPCRDLSCCRSAPLRSGEHVLIGHCGE